jgi:pilus assembly protein CpaC
MKPSSNPMTPTELPSLRRFVTLYFLEEVAASLQRSRFMKSLSLITAALLLVAIPVFASNVAESSAAASAPSQDNPQTNTAPANNAPTPPANSAGSATENPAAAPLRVMVGKSILINTTERLRRVSVTDPSVADALVVTPTQVLVNGLAPGEISLLIWDELERSRSFDLRVDVDITAAREEMTRLFPNEQIEVTPSRNAIVLSGHVTTEDVSKHAGALASAYSKNVVNVLTFGPVGAQEVLLEVKFAEVDRSAISQLGINMFTTGTGNTIGTITTGQFGGVAGLGTINDTGSGSVFPSTTTVSNLLNMFFFNPQVHLGAVIEALQQKNLLQILAEPNLVAVNGKEASFLAGGEFPFPVVQPGVGGAATVTIQFREFGVRLKFTPVIQPNGNIHLHVTPEVSTLDLADGVSVAGTTIPALSTRKADTEFELQDGQSFIIAGLIDNRVTDIVNKVPGLGDIPILGAFFRSKSLQKSNSELMVLCTARRISPSAEAPKGPPMPLPVLDTTKFDGKRP